MKFLFFKITATYNYFFHSISRTAQALPYTHANAERQPTPPGQRRTAFMEENLFPPGQCFAFRTWILTWRAKAMDGSMGEHRAHNATLQVQILLHNRMVLKAIAAKAAPHSSPREAADTRSSLPETKTPLFCEQALLQAVCREKGIRSREAAPLSCHAASGFRFFAALCRRPAIFRRQGEGRRDAKTKCKKKLKHRSA